MYVRQQNDAELEVWFAEIRLRASIRIGELVRDLDTAKPGPAGADNSHRRDVSPKRDPRKPMIWDRVETLWKAGRIYGSPIDPIGQVH